MRMDQLAHQLRSPDEGLDYQVIRLATAVLPAPSSLDVDLVLLDDGIGHRYLLRARYLLLRLPRLSSSSLPAASLRATALNSYGGRRVCASELTC